MLGALTAVALLGVGLRLTTPASAAAPEPPALESATVAPASASQVASEAAIGTASAASAASARRTAPASPSVRARPRGGASSGCDPFFTIDSSGIKVPKPNCIR